MKGDEWNMKKMLLFVLAMVLVASISGMARAQAVDPYLGVPLNSINIFTMKPFSEAGGSGGTEESKLIDPFLGVPLNSINIFTMKPFSGPAFRTGGTEQSKAIDPYLGVPLNSLNIFTMKPF